MYCHVCHVFKWLENNKQRLELLNKDTDCIKHCDKHNLTQYINGLNPLQNFQGKYDSVLNLKQFICSLYYIVVILVLQ